MMRLKLLLFSLVFVSAAAFGTVTGISKATSAGHTRTLATAYTATISSATNATAVTTYYRDGQFLVIDGKAKWTGAGGAGAFTVAIPTAGAIVIDTASLVGGAGATNQTTTVVGTGDWFDSGNGWLFVYPVFVDTTHFGFVMNTQALDGSQLASGDAINFHVQVPILGWN